MNTQSSRVRAFTLIEILVVIAIIAVLVGLALPALSKARGSGRAVACLARLRDLAVGTVAYSNDYKRFPRTEARFDTARGYATMPAALDAWAPPAALPTRYRCPSDNLQPRTTSSFEFLPARFMRPIFENADYLPLSDAEGIETPTGILRMFSEDTQGRNPLWAELEWFHKLPKQRPQGVRDVQASYFDGSAGIWK